MGLCPHALCTHHTNTALTPHRRKLLQAGLLSEAEVKRLQVFQGFRPFVLHVWALRSLQVCELHMRMRMHMHAALLHCVQHCVYTLALLTRGVRSAVQAQEVE